MKTIIIATSNQHKVDEFQAELKGIQVLSLKDIGFYEDIIEDGTTFEQNATIKAKAVSEFLRRQGKLYPVLADDSGLCVDVLNGEPGLTSARYSGERNDDKNRQKLLENLKGKTNRKAHFLACLVVYFPDGSYICEEGKTYGEITHEIVGDEKSFGYDCLFYSYELNKAFSECTIEEKNTVSHRTKAIRQLKQRLNDMNIVDI